MTKNKCVLNAQKNGKVLFDFENIGTLIRYGI